MENDGFVRVSGAVEVVEGTLPSGLQRRDARKAAQIQSGGNLRNTVTWQDAEDTLMAAFEYLGAMPDRERAYLAAGSRTAWPAIVREAFGDYADVETSPSPAHPPLREPG